MKPVVTAQSVRDAEAAWFAAHPGEDLMAVAAAAVAEAAARVVRTASGRPEVLVVAGAGNNAGDALYAAAGLPDLLGAPVRIVVWPCGGTTPAGGLAACAALGATIVDAAGALEALGDVSVVLDGVSGLGGRAGLDADVAAVADACRGRVTVVAVDIPSGLAADSHRATTSFHADETVTFIAHKLAHVARPAADRCGRVTLVDIGVAAPASDLAVVEASDLAAWYPWPDAASDKYARGVVGLDTGSPDYPGAAVLGAAGALWAGAGMIRYAGPVRDAVLARFPSVVAPPDTGSPGRVQAWVCGSGWDAAGAPGRLARRVADGVPVVLDAGALDVLPGDLPPGSLLPPHAGELARMLGVERADVEDAPVGHARAAAARHGATVLLKGATQYVASPDGRVLVALPGLAWTAAAGSGDVLAGACGALLAAGLAPERAAALAASLQAEASRRRPGPVTPERLAEEFAGVLARWAKGAPGVPGVPGGEGLLW